MIVLGTPPEAATSPRGGRAAGARGAHRSLGKEVGRGATAQLVYVAPGAEDQIELDAALPAVAALGVRVRPGGPDRPARGAERAVDWERPLERQDRARHRRRARDRRGDRRGARARRRARRRPRRPRRGERPRGRRSSAARRCRRHHRRRRAREIAAHLLDAHGGVDVVVHNAGVTRDKTLARMTEEPLGARCSGSTCSRRERIDRELLDARGVRDDGRIVCVSSISGIAGNAGQTNYATSKAGRDRDRAGVAPSARERGRHDQRGRARVHRDADDGGDADRRPRGRPPDEQPRARAACRSTSPRRSRGSPVPARPASTGNVVRVCGQSLLGA